MGVHQQTDWLLIGCLPNCCKSSCRPITVEMLLHTASLLAELAILCTVLVTSSATGHAGRQSPAFIAISFVSTCFSFVVNIIGVRIILQKATHAAVEVGKRMSDAIAVRQQLQRGNPTATCNVLLSYQN
jgi:hypothetical protein